MPTISAARRTHTSARSASSQPVLRQGARGWSVAVLQQKLKAVGLNPGPVDGIFGPRTQTAVRWYQATRRLSVDGVVGPQTWGALNRNAPAVGGSRPVDSFSPGGTRVTGYVNGRPVNITVASIGNGKTLRSDAASAFNRMKEAARRAGVTLSPVSGFRSMAQQQHLYNLYKSGRGNLAARPGYSNHQAGRSVDVSTGGSYSSSSYRWLAAHGRAYGFVNDVRGEPWHWTYRG